jgi:alpha-L-fucosidase 2
LQRNFHADFIMRYGLSFIGVLLFAACGMPEQGEMKLRYDQPATFFEEALPIGNGRLGAMVYGGTRQDKLSLNDITLWTGEPEQKADHVDMELYPNVTPWGESWKYVEEVRQALEAEDYAKAEQLQHKIQGHYSENYQPLGTLTISYPDAEISEYKRELDISEAVARVSYRRNGKRFNAEYFASAPDSVIVVRFKSEEPLDAVLSLDYPHPHEAVCSDDRITVDGYVAYHSYPNYFRTRRHERFMYSPDRGIHYRTVLFAECDGQTEQNGHSLSLKGVKEAVIKIVNSTSFNGFDHDPVREGKPYRELADANAQRVSEKSYRTIQKDHIADYRSFFDRLTINLGKTDPKIKALPTDVQLKLYSDENQVNPELEALYFQYGRYLLISSSRTPGVPANLQGLWNESMEPPWSGNYTININLQENYWPAEPAALPEMHEVMLDYVDNMSVSGRETARNYLGVDQGWASGHNSDIWAMTNPVGLGTGDPNWANWYMSSPWLATHIWEHYLFTRDLERLKKDYPALKGAAEFCMAWLVEKDGELITSPSTSPENKYITDKGFHGATLYGGTADIAMICECLMDAADASNLLSDSVFNRRVRSYISRLRGYHIGADGHLMEWYYDWADEDPQHRHQSHLFGVYPGHQISGGEYADAALKSLEIKGFETTGWSCGWRINLYARLRDGENAYHMYRRLLRYISPDNYRGPDARRGGGTYPNLFDAHSPFQIDGNFGGCAGVMEMLLRSEEHLVDPLPALPAAWPNGYIRGIRTRTGQTVNLVWRNGKVKSFKVTQ